MLRRKEIMGKVKEGPEKWRKEAVRGMQQVCKEEIRILQVSLQDWYIDLGDGEQTMRCGQVHYCELGFEYYLICSSVIVF